MRKTQIPQGLYTRHIYILQRTLQTLRRQISTGQLSKRQALIKGENAIQKTYTDTLNQATQYLKNKGFNTDTLIDNEELLQLKNQTIKDWINIVDDMQRV